MSHSDGHDIDPTFYRSSADAISAPPEQLAYLAAYDRAAQQPDGADFGSLRVHQVRLQGGDSSPDSCCYPS